MYVKYPVEVLKRDYWLNIDLDDFPSSDSCSDWKKWSKPLVEAMNDHREFALYEDFDTWIADGVFVYKNGIGWIMTLDFDDKKIEFDSEGEIIERSASEQVRTED